MNRTIAAGVLGLAVMFAGTAKAEVLPDGDYTFTNTKGTNSWIFVMSLTKVKEVDTPGKKGEKNGVYHVHTKLGWLTSKSNEGAVIDARGQEKESTWELHKNSNGWNFIHADNRANALSVVGINPKGGGKPTGEFKLRRNNADGNADQLFDMKKGHQ